MRHRLYEMMARTKTFMTMGAYLFIAYAVTFLYVLFEEDKFNCREYVPKYKRSIVKRIAIRTIASIETWLIPPWNWLQDTVFSWKTTRKKSRRKYSNPPEDDCSQQQSEDDESVIYAKDFRNFPKTDRVKQWLILLHSVEDERQESEKSKGELEARTARFDTDSRLIRVDNCASRCITPSIDDFVGVPQDTTRMIKGSVEYKFVVPSSAPSSGRSKTTMAKCTSSSFRTPTTCQERQD